MQKRHFRQPQGAKKAGNLITDFLLGVPLHGGGYSVVGIDYTSKRNLNNAFRSVSMMYSSMSLSACPSVHKGSVPYAAAVILQDCVDRFRLAAGSLYDCVIGEKPVIPHAPFPPFPRKAAVWLCGYGSPLRCGCVRTACRFHAVGYA